MQYLSDYITEAKRIVREDDGVPLFVTWDKTKYLLVPAKEYRAVEHGCVEKCVYPPDYKYPHPDPVAVLDENLELW